MAALNRRVERAGLLSNLGPCCKALCARRDFGIRKQLLKNDKVNWLQSLKGPFISLFISAVVGLSFGVWSSHLVVILLSVRASPNSIPWILWWTASCSKWACVFLGELWLVRLLSQKDPMVGPIQLLKMPRRIASATSLWDSQRFVCHEMHNAAFSMEAYEHNGL